MCQLMENKVYEQYASCKLKKSYRILATASYTLLDLSDEIRQSVVVNYGILSKLDKRFIRMAQRS